MLAEEMAAEEVVETAVALGANEFIHTPETWPTIAGPVDNTQWVWSMTATPASKKGGAKDEATTTNCMGGDNFWTQENRVKPSQQDHASYKGKSATRWQEPGLDTNENKYKIGTAAFNKIKPALLLNYYSILSNAALPPCQVKAQVTSSTSIANILTSIQSGKES
jgi:hypothetical protein